MHFRDECARVFSRMSNDKRNPNAKIYVRVPVLGFELIYWNGGRETAGRGRLISPSTGSEEGKKSAQAHRMICARARGVNMFVPSRNDVYKRYFFNLHIIAHTGITRRLIPDKREKVVFVCIYIIIFFFFPITQSVGYRERKLVSLRYVNPTELIDRASGALKQICTFIPSPRQMRAFRRLVSVHAAAVFYCCPLASFDLHVRSRRLIIFLNSRRRTLRVLRSTFSSTQHIIFFFFYIL